MNNIQFSAYSTLRYNLETHATSQAHVKLNQYEITAYYCIIEMAKCVLLHHQHDEMRIIESSTRRNAYYCIIEMAKCILLHHRDGEMRIIASSKWRNAYYSIIEMAKSSAWCKTGGSSVDATSISPQSHSPP